MIGISALLKRDTRGIISISTMWGHSYKVAICKGGFYQTSNLLARWSWISYPLELGEVNIFCLSYTVWCILF